MGVGKSLPQDELHELISSTYFKKEELNRWYNKFIRDYPEGQLNKEQFMGIFRKIYKSGNAEQLAGHIFRAFDIKHDNRISFKELMCSLSVITRGTAEEKLEWAFNVYDIDQNGFITLEEICSIVRSMRQMENASEEKMNEDTVSEMFRAMDINSDGRLSLQEFVVGAQKDPTFVNMLNGTESSMKSEKEEAKGETKLKPGRKKIHR